MRETSHVCPNAYRARYASLFLAILAGLTLGVALAGPVHAAIEISPGAVYNDWGIGSGLYRQVDIPEVPDSVGDSVAVRVGARFDLGRSLGGDLRFAQTVSDMTGTGWYTRHSTFDALVAYRVGPLRLLAGPTIINVSDDSGYQDGGWGFKAGLSGRMKIGSKLRVDGDLFYAPRLNMARRWGYSSPEEFGAESIEGDLVMTYPVFRDISVRLGLSASQLTEDLATGSTLTYYEMVSLGASYQF